jgi:hypothetical protein
MGITERSVQFLGREWLLPIFGTPEGVLIKAEEASLFAGSEIKLSATNLLS